MRFFVLVVAAALLSFTAMAILLASRRQAPEGAEQHARPERQISQEHIVQPEPVVAPKGVHIDVTPLPQKRESASQAGLSYQALFQMGDHNAAIDAIEDLLKNDPENTRLIKDLGTALYAAALTDFERKDYAKAIEKLRRSLALGNQSARPALARVLVTKGQTSEAIQLLEAHSQQSQDQNTLEALIDLHIALENHEDADRLLREYSSRSVPPTEVSSSTPHLAEPTAAAQRQREIYESHLEFLKSRRERLSRKKDLQERSFVIKRDGLEVRYFSSRAESLAERVVSVLSNSIERLNSRFGNMPWGASVVAWLVEKKGFQTATGAPPWAGALFDGIIRIPYSESSLRSETSWRHLRKMIHHEATHAHLYTICGDRIPSWLGEGLAQVHEGKNPRSAQSALQNLHGKDWQKLQRNKGEDLDARFFQIKDSELVSSLYARSLFLVGQLENRHGTGIWSRVVQQLCTSDVPYHDVLESLFGARTTEALWEKMLP